MITRKLVGFGNLGVELQDVDLQTIGLEEMHEIGFTSLDQLLVVIPRKCVNGISLERFHEICVSWVLDPHGDFAYTGKVFQKWMAKYGSDLGPDGLPPNVDEDDRKMMEEGYRIRQGIEHLPGMSRVTGKRDEQGNNTGMFADGELEWHSNNQGAESRAPGVGLLAWEGSTGSRTEFLNTVDPYHALNSEWRSVCDELVAVHRWQPGVMAPGLSATQEKLLKFNMCPDDDMELPLVMESPGGLRGLHFGFATIRCFKGMSDAESQKTIEYLKSQVLRDEYMYGHDWEDGDLLFFDNSITLHRRPTKDCSKRLMYRMAFLYDRLLQMRAEGRAEARQTG